MHIVPPSTLPHADRVIARRQVVLALAAGALAPFASFAQQQPTKVARIGFLGVATASNMVSRVEALRTGLRDLGYVEGKNIVFEFRYADGKDARLAELAAELVRLKVDVLVTHTTVGVQAAKLATTTIPIVIAATADAVATGLVASLARPGGNITGSTLFALEIDAKRIELLKNAVPRITRVACLLRPSASSGPILQSMELTARSLKVEVKKFELPESNEFDSNFSAMIKSGVDALVIHDDPVLSANAKAIAEFAAKHRIASAGSAEFAEAGSLIGFGVNIFEMFRRAAYFVDKILKGAKPADLPVEQATKFDFVVNMKTAKTLGIKFPNSILVQATKVIE